MNGKVITSLFILVLIFGFYGIIITNFSYNEAERENDLEVNEKAKLKSSTWLVHSISIDDYDTGFTDWDTINSTYPWCNGAGTWYDPYIIEDVYVDGQGDNDDGIVIQNSDVPFIIKECDVYNIGTWGGTGIYLNNVNNSLITDCVAAQCGAAGITMRGSCNNNTIVSTSVYDNHEEGIYIDLYGVNEILEFSFNNISAHSIYMSDDEGIKVDIDLMGDSTLYFYNNSFIDNHVFAGDDHGISFIAEAEDTSIINFNYTMISDNMIQDNDGMGITFDIIAYDNAHIYFNNMTIAENGIAWHEINGIQVDGSEEGNGVVEWNDNRIIHNYIIENDIAGIALVECSNFFLRDNMMQEDGLAIASENLDSASSHDIDDSNEVNGKPIYYIKDQNGLTPLDYPNAGQVLIVNCNDSLIAHTDVSDDVFGISIGWGENNTIYNNTADNANYAAIILYKSHENNVTDNNIGYSQYFGLYLDKSNYNNISENTINNNDMGIVLDTSIHNNFTDNTIRGNQYGIYFDHSNFTRVINNTLQCNSVNFLEDSYSHDNVLAPNTFLPCYKGGDGDDDDDDDKEEEVISGYDLFLFISTIFIFLGAIYVILVRKRITF